MKPCRFVLVILAVSLWGSTPAGAQFWAGSPYNGGGWGWGGYPLGNFNNTAQIAGQDKQVGEVASGVRNLAIGTSTRNMMTNQAQSRVAGIQDQRQDYRDWWLQTQAQQNAQRKAAGYGGGATVACGYGGAAPAGGFRPLEPENEVNLDVIKWPTLLQRPTFASRRARIEAPYRRSPPGLSTPKPADYREMVNTAEEMKSMCDWLTREGVDTNEYKEAVAFLNQIEQEARQRS